MDELLHRPDDNVDLLIAIYLCTSEGKVMGNLVVNEDRLVFHPIVCFENPRQTELSQFRAEIDLHDIVDCFQI